MHRYVVSRSIISAVGVLLLVFAVAGCKDIALFALEPYPDVSVVASVRNVSYHDFETPGRTTFVHFRYVVTVRSDTPLYFKVEEIAVSINGQKNREAYYDSVASIIPQWKLLKKDETVIDAYAVFPGTVDASSVPNVEFINLGFSRKPGKGAS